MKNPPIRPHKFDSLGRRDRSQPKSTGKRVQLTNVDLLRFAFIQSHGDLPTSLIHECTKHLSINLDSTRHRLGTLFHEDNTPHNGRYLHRSHNQKQTDNSSYNFSVYRLTEKGKKALKDAGLYVEHTARSSSSWKHDFLRACYSASIELLCLKEPGKYEYIPHHVIVGRVGKDSFSVEGHKFTPDLVHGIRYKETDAVRLFMVEIDCHTEQVTITKKNKFDSFEKKLEVYKKYIAGGLYKNDFGIGGGLMLAVITTNQTHMFNLMNLVTKSNFMLFNIVSDFDFGFVPPKKPFALFNEPWFRPGQEEFYMNAA